MKHNQEEIQFLAAHVYMSWNFFRDKVAPKNFTVQSRSDYILCLWRHVTVDCSLLF